MHHDHRKPVRVRRIDKCHSVHEIFEHCLPAFGGAILRRAYSVLDRAIAMKCPLTLFAITTDTAASTPTRKIPYMKCRSSATTVSFATTASFVSPIWASTRP